MTTTAVDDNRWVRRFHPAPDTAPRLICFPYAGGSAGYFLPVSRALAPALDVLAVQYPGRQDRRLERQVDNLPELADRIAPALAGWTGGRYAFFGHSMGAILAFEVARRLERTGTGPAWLFASGRRAPSIQREETVHLRDDAGFLAELRQLGGTDRRILADPELLAMILPVTRADYRATETYVCPPGPPLSCPITVLTGDRDPKTTVEEASAWAAHTTAGFDLKVFPGAHFYIEEHRSSVIDVIRDTLTGASVEE
jgi:surfactin synthase thioesterase subunit